MAAAAAFTLPAAAAFTLPAAVGALPLGRFLRDRSPVQLPGWDATLRTCALGAIPIAPAFKMLSVGGYVVLLALSSVLHSWGQGGLYTLIALLLPEKDHLAGPNCHPHGAHLDEGCGCHTGYLCRTCGGGDVVARTTREQFYRPDTAPEVEPLNALKLRRRAH